MGWSGLLLPKLVMINMLLGHHDEILKLCGLLQDWADQPQCAHDGRHGLGRLCLLPTAFCPLLLRLLAAINLRWTHRLSTQAGASD